MRYVPSPMEPPRELRDSYVRALADMDKRLSVLTQQRDDARAELDNVTPLLAQSTRLIGALGTELAQALSEIAQLRIALRERNELIATLTDQ